MNHAYDRLRSRLSEFVAERDWHQFHSPKNMAICLSVEANELLEHYTWTRSGPGPHPPGAAEPNPADVAGEVADVFLCLLNFCTVTGIDLLDETNRKLSQLGEKYPVHVARGSAIKGTDPGTDTD